MKLIMQHKYNQRKMIARMTSGNTITSRKKKLIICGKGASGKDFLRKYLEQYGCFKYAISMTTRPKRDNETNGVDYNFVTIEQFDDALSKNLLKEYEIFNQWKYGTTLKEWDSKNLFILTPSAISRLTREDIAQSYIVYLDIAKSVRRDRLSKRGDSEDPERRLVADDKIFELFTDFHKRITYDRFNPTELVEDIIREMKMDEEWI
jgi:guanylate kinase